MRRLHTPFARRAEALATLLLLLATALVARAQDMSETTIEIPVSVVDAKGTPVSRAVVTTVVALATPARRPFLLLLHGRPTNAKDMARFGRADYPANARYFARLGFVVFVPTRIGYGVTGGPDLEYSGPCEQKDYARGVIPALDESAALIGAIRERPDVDAAHGLVVGDSYGGLLAVGLAQRAPAGVQGAVNVSGGDGGDVPARIDAPCAPDRLAALFARFGTHEQLPTLWLYSANDRLWGPRNPMLWFGAYTAAGGHGTFGALPADKNNGHYIFNRNAPAWHPAFESFLRATGWPRWLPPMADATG
jgi:dienelactone hydrolase